MTAPLSAPAQWRETRLDRVASVRARIGWKALTADEYVDDGVVFLATPNIKASSIDFVDVNRIPGWRYDESPELKLRLGDVVLAKDGNTLGITNIVTSLPEPATVNGSIAILRPYAIEPRYLRYWIASDFIQGQIATLKGGMGVPHLFQRDINRLPILLPPLDEQCRIADFLDGETTRLDAAASRSSQAHALAAEHLEAITDDALLTGQVDFQPLRRVVKSVTVGVVVNPSTYVSPDGTVPFYRGADVRPFELDTMGAQRITTQANRVLRKSVLAAGDLVMVRVGDPGATAVVPPEGEGSNCASLLVLRGSPATDSAYLCQVLNSRYGRGNTRALATGAAQLQVNASAITRFPVPMRPLQVQRVIAARLEAERLTVQRLLNASHSQRQLLVERRQALITAAVTGELDVTTASRASG